MWLKMFDALTLNKNRLLKVKKRYLFCRSFMSPVGIPAGFVHGSRAIQPEI
jgi:hypothetical protein